MTKSYISEKITAYVYIHTHIHIYINIHTQDKIFFIVSLFLYIQQQKVSMTEVESFP